MNAKFARMLGKGKRGFRCTERRDHIRLLGKERLLDGYVLVKLSRGKVIEETTHFRGRIVKGWQPEWLAKRNMVGGIKVPEGIVEVPTSMEALLEQVKEGTIDMTEALKLIPKLQPKEEIAKDDGQDEKVAA
jgi:hypothetical protein